MTYIDRHFFTLCFYALVTHAANVQDDWVFPYPAASTESPASMTVGDTVRIQWTDNLWGWFSTYSPYSSVSDVDLWITGYDLHQYQHLVTSKYMPILDYFR